jgi:hypothetical protein
MTKGQAVWWLPRSFGPFGEAAAARLATLGTTLRGEVDHAVDLGRQLALRADLDWDFTNMLYPPIVSPAALTIASLLSVFKPWGRIRPNC